MPAKVKESIISYVEYDCGKSSDELRINISESIFHSDVIINIDGAVEGAKRIIAKKTADKNPHFIVTERLVSGPNARRVSYVGESHTRKIYMDALLINGENIVWTITIYSDNYSSSSDVHRIIESVVVQK